MGHILEDNTVFIGVRTSNPACNISEWLFDGGPSWHDELEGCGNGSGIFWVTVSAFIWHGRGKSRQSLVSVRLDFTLGHPEFVSIRFVALWCKYTSWYDVCTFRDLYIRCSKYILSVLNHRD
jgi:hypothetical protein